jgi:hypothetical protein
VRLLGSRPPAGRDTQGGSAVVEAVLVVPVAMTLVLLVVQASLWAHAAQVVQSAAAQGVQAATDLGGTFADGEAGAKTFLASDRSVVQPRVTVAPAPDGEVVVRVTATATSIVPFFHLDVSAVRLGTVQEFRRDE